MHFKSDICHCSQYMEHANTKAHNAICMSTHFTILIGSINGKSLTVTAIRLCWVFKNQW